MKRRTTTRLNAQRLIDEVLHAPIEWPWKTTRLERHSLSDYQQRSVTANVSIAELYHENSKLYPQLLPELAVTQVQPDEFRREVIHLQSAAALRSELSEIDLDHRWRSLLTTISKETELELFYAVEICLVTEKALAIYAPISDTLQLVKHLSNAELDLLRRALRLLVNPQAPQHSGPLLFILGCFARYDMLLGQRGYRRTLIDAGRVAQALLYQATRFSLTMRPVYEFTDRDIDAVLEADGVEKGVLIAFELEEATHDT